MTLRWLALMCGLCLITILGRSSWASDAKPPRWTLENALSDVRSLSCEEHFKSGSRDRIKFDTVTMNVSEVTPSPLQLDHGVTLSGAWHLTSASSTLGGLSGLAIDDDGHLLSVSDMGRFIQIPLQDGVPTGEAFVIEMALPALPLWPRKLSADAEGLEYRDGMALVSFERNFRILGFDLKQCGAAAQGILIAKPPSHYDQIHIDSNQGPEALMVDEKDQLQIGYEHPHKGHAVIGTVQSEREVAFADTSNRVALEAGFHLVGMDNLTITAEDTISAQLFRAYDENRGNRSILRFETDRSYSIPPIRLEPPLILDNFEGIALTEHGDHLRAYLISDNNFSPNQKTLLYAIDIALLPPRP